MVGEGPESVEVGELPARSPLPRVSQGTECDAFADSRLPHGPERIGAALKRSRRAQAEKERNSCDGAPAASPPPRPLPP